MTDKSNIHPLPDIARDKIQAAMSELARLMPQQAAMAKTMMDSYQKAGFTEDQALKLVAYAIFKQ